MSPEFVGSTPWMCHTYVEEWSVPARANARDVTTTSTQEAVMAGRYHWAGDL